MASQKLIAKRIKFWFPLSLNCGKIEAGFKRIIMFDGFDFILFWIIFLIYVPACLISTIFTFSIERYKRIEEKLNFEILADTITTPLDRNIDWFNRWMVSNNKKAGPILILLSLIDLKLFFDLLNNFQFPP